MFVLIQEVITNPYEYYLKQQIKALNKRFSLNLNEIVNSQTISLDNANTYGSFKLYDNNNAIITCSLKNLHNTD